MRARPDWPRLRGADLGLDIYAIWSGAGTAVVAMIGIAWFKEPVTMLKLASLGLIVAGVVGLQLDSAGAR